MFLAATGTTSSLAIALLSWSSSPSAAAATSFFVPGFGAKKLVIFVPSVLAFLAGWGALAASGARLALTR